MADNERPTTNYWPQTLDSGLRTAVRQQPFNRLLHLRGRDTQNAFGLFVNEAAITRTGIAFERILDHLMYYLPRVPDL